MSFSQDLLAGFLRNGFFFETVDCKGWTECKKFGLEDWKARIITKDDH